MNHAYFCCGDRYKKNLRNSWLNVLKMDSYDVSVRFHQAKHVYGLSYLHVDIQYAQWFLARNHFGRCFFVVICHKISEKCRWNHSETFTVKIYKLGPKCRWNILIVSDNTAAKIIRVHIHETELHVFFCFLFV
jgi:hypothetical protein